MSSQQLFWKTDSVSHVYVIIWTITDIRKAELWAWFPRAAGACQEAARWLDVILSGPARRFCHWLEVAIMHHLQLLRIKSIEVCKVLHKIYILNWKSSEAPWWKGKLLKFSYTRGLLPSPLRFSKTGKETFPKPIEVIGYSLSVRSAVWGSSCLCKRRRRWVK